MTKRAPGKPRTGLPGAPYRLIGIVGCVILAAAVIFPSRSLGEQAVFGAGHLWGDAGTRLSSDASWFVDEWEMVQHAIFVGCVVTSLALIATGKRGVAEFLAALFGLLLLADVFRTLVAEGVGWVKMAKPFFWVVSALVVALPIALRTVPALKAPARRRRRSSHASSGRGSHRVSGVPRSSSRPAERESVPTQADEEAPHSEAGARTPTNS